MLDNLVSQISLDFLYTHWIQGSDNPLSRLAAPTIYRRLIFPPFSGRLSVERIRIIVALCSFLANQRNLLRFATARHALGFGNNLFLDFIEEWVIEGFSGGYALLGHEVEQLED